METTIEQSVSTPLKAKDFASDQEVKWCPGCGDYSILKQVQSTLASTQQKREETVFISGIGCSSRFPYYLNTYGMHTVHGRAPAFATGLKAARPDLNVWIVTGDGDGLSIGGNHFIHLLRRNPDVNLLLFNNEIYGLTKGQFSPTSPRGTVNKTAVRGTIESPFNPAALALGADASFVARSMDRDPKHLQAVLERANSHAGTSFVEIYQNCNVFNDGAFFAFTEKESKAENSIFLEHGAPLVFGKNRDRGIVLEGAVPKVVDLKDGISENDLWIHDEQDYIKATILSRFFEDPRQEGAFPRPFGVTYAVAKNTFDAELTAQVELAEQEESSASLEDLLKGRSSWSVEE